MRFTGAVRNVAITVGATLIAGFAAAAPAHADIGYVPSPDTSATVTHLNLSNRQGHIGVVLTVGSDDQVIGFTVSLPPAGGTWEPARSVAFAGSHLTCVGRVVTDPASVPTYSCLTPLDPQDDELHQLIPVGIYPVSLPISRPTGPVDGVTGAVAVNRADPFEDDYLTEPDDTFPVLDFGKDGQSSTEVKNLDLGNTGLGSLYVGNLTLHIVIKPGETITGVYAYLPTDAGVGGIAAFTAENVEFASLGIGCGQDYSHPAPPGDYAISCLEMHPHSAVWPVGAYKLTVPVAGIGQGESDAQVQLRLLDGSFRLVDTFTARTDYWYPAPKSAISWAAALGRPKER